jgi:hypothetical protein
MESEENNGKEGGGKGESATYMSESSSGNSNGKSLRSAQVTCDDFFSLDWEMLNAFKLRALRIVGAVCWPDDQKNSESRREKKVTNLDKRSEMIFWRQTIDLCGWDESR